MRAAVKMALGGLLAKQLVSLGMRRRRAPLLRESTAVVCGASRGLGRAIALELARRGVPRIAICARDGERLEELSLELSSKFETTVVAETCDLEDEEDVRRFLDDVRMRMGRPIDILVTNAATIQVAPVDALTKADFDKAMSTTFYTALHPVLAMIPEMKKRKRGTIAVVSSIGGKVGVPHLAPYCSAKFAIMGMIESLRGELANEGINVLAITPGLMRTGSHIRAEFKGDQASEYAWFSAAATAPVISIDATRAARRIVAAIAQGKSELSFTPEARIAPIVRTLMPNLWSSMMQLTAKLLPKSHSMFPRVAEPKEGRVIERETSSPIVNAIAEHGRAYSAKHAQL